MDKYTIIIPENKREPETTDMLENISLENVVHIENFDITKHKQSFSPINEDILSEQLLEDGKNETFFNRILNENTSFIDYAENGLLVHDLHYDMSSLGEETIKTMHTDKITEIETIRNGNEIHVRGTIESSQGNNLNGCANYINIKQVRGATKATKTWECGICNKEFQHHYTLMRHLPTHTDIRKYICSVCGRAFRQMSTLSQHKTIHTNVRAHVCEICKKAYNRISTLISHRRTHSELKPHKCPVCGKGFHQKGNMRNHVFTHTNERPYKCEVCCKGFNQMSNLMCHKQHVHGDLRATFCCEDCEMTFELRSELNKHKTIHQTSYTSNNTEGDMSSAVVKESSNFDESFNNCLVSNQTEPDDDKENLEVDWNHVEFATPSDYTTNNENSAIDLNSTEFIELGVPISIEQDNINDRTCSTVFNIPTEMSQFIKITPTEIFP